MKKPYVKKFRRFCATLNNYTDLDEHNLKQFNYHYLLFSREVAPTTGTPHLHIYVELNQQMTMSAIQKKMSNRLANIDDILKNSTPEKYITYCKKDGNFYEDGTPRKQGERTDLDDLKNDILNNTSNVNSIVVENPMAFHQYGRTLERIERIHLRTKFRTWMTKGYWLYGATGVGKSHMVFQDFDPKTCYVKNKLTKFWDGYTGQEKVIINEFRGQIDFSDLLDLVDKWPMEVDIKGGEKVPFLAKEVWITSCAPPNEIYKNSLTAHDKIDQFYRRFEITHLTSGFEEEPQKCSEGNNEPLSTKKIVPKEKIIRKKQITLEDIEKNIKNI